MENKWSWPKTVLAIIIILAALVLARKFLYPKAFSPTPSNTEQGSEQPSESEIETVSEDLNIPWEIAFLPDGEILVTERPGFLKRIGQNGQSTKVDGVKHIGEGGLLGMALHPDFEENHFIYLYFTSTENGATRNRVERFRLENSQLLEQKTI